MELSLENKSLLGQHGDVRMSEGDRLSITFTTYDGETILVTSAATAAALAIKQERTGDELFIQSKRYGNAFLSGR